MRVLLVDEVPLFMAGLQHVVQATFEGAEVDCVDGVRAAQTALLNERPFDLVLLSVGDDESELDLLLDMADVLPAVPTIAIVGMDCNETITRAIRCGAMGVLPRRATHSLLRQALLDVVAGRIYVPPAPTRDAGGSGRRGRTEARPSSMGKPYFSAGVPTPPLPLTPRQSDVLALLMRGQSNKHIARELNVSVDTIKEHVTAVLRSLNVSSRTQAVLAIRRLRDRDRGRDDDAAREGATRGVVEAMRTR